MVYLKIQPGNNAHVDTQHNNWAVTCDFQQCGILTSVDTYLSLGTPNAVQSVA